MVNQYKKGQNKRIDAFRKKVVPVRMQNNNQNRNSVATVHSNPDNNDSEWQAASAKCTKSIVEVNSMLQNNDIKDIESVKPTPLPRQNLPKQANNDTIGLSIQEAISLQNSGNIAQKRRKQGLNSSSKPGTKITIETNGKSTETEREPTNIQERMKSLKKMGLYISDVLNYILRPIIIT